MTNAEEVQQYIDGVLDGSRVTGRLERLAVHRHVADLQLAESRGLYFDSTIADKAIEFSKFCNQFEGEWAGLPLRLRPEQKFIVWCLMGWRKEVDGLRRFRQVQIEAARGWGKSTFVAYLSCLLLFADTPFEEGAQGYVAATKQGQAKIVWRYAKEMIQRSPLLKGRSVIKEYLNVIELPKSRSFFLPLSADKTPDGFNAHFIIKDEEHAYRERHRGMTSTLSSGLSKRRQPLVATITTYGSDDSEIWLENHNYAVRCLESVITGEIVDDSWFALICAIDYQSKESAPVPCFGCKGEDCPWCNGTGEIPNDNPYDESIWFKANPGMGDGSGFTPKLSGLRADALLAKQRADKRHEFFQKNLNIIVSSQSRALTAEAWMASRGTPSMRTDVTGHGGVDLSAVGDFASAAIVWPLWCKDDDGQMFVRYECVTKTWTMKDRHPSIDTPLIRGWIESGHLLECSGDAIDFIEVERAILDWHGMFSVETWAYDIKFAVMLAQRLEAEGLTMFAFSQSHKFYTNPLGELLRCVGRYRVVNGEKVPLFMHDGNPCVSWQAGNLLIDKKPNGEMMPDKSTSANKIDVMVAILMALSECLYHQQQSDGYWLTNKLVMGG